MIRKEAFEPQQLVRVEKNVLEVPDIKSCGNKINIEKINKNKTKTCKNRKKVQEEREEEKEQKQRELEAQEQVY